MSNFYNSKEWLKVVKTIRDKSINISSLEQALFPYEEGTWISKDGIKKIISEMDDNYINNCIDFLEKRLLKLDKNDNLYKDLLKKKKEFIKELNNRTEFNIRGAL